MRHHWVPKVVKFAPLFAIVAIIALGFVVMALWNWLMPAIFGLKTIGYLQAFGLLILSWILFGGLRGRYGVQWRNRMAERWAEHWMQMSPEEREMFRKDMRHRWHHHDHEPDTYGPDSHSDAPQR
ncbi:MAG TPA: hypothetical protein VNF48_02305 [Gammaproteobacteria bacterium]|nr:hypothetical protein [Gammaproteobacteria bacterium]